MRTEDIPGAILISLAVLAAAALLHWGLRRAGRRLPRLIARMRGDTSPALVLRLDATVDLVLLLPKLLLWVGVAIYVTDQFMALQTWRGMLVSVVDMGVTA